MKTSSTNEQTARSRSLTTSITAKIAHRVYLATMRIESARFMPLRRWLVDRILNRRHEALFVFPDVFLEDCDGLSLGRHVSINRGSNISAGGGVEIGDYVAIGHRASILSSNHGFEKAGGPIKYQPVTFAPVKIGNNVWLGANVTVLAGVSIADGTLVAAGSVVTSSVDEPDTVIGGIPAKKISVRPA